MSEIFIAEFVVHDRRDADDRLAELREPAEKWFGGPVERVSVEVIEHSVDGARRYLVSARFRKDHRREPDRPVGRLERAARWMGLVEKG